MHTVHRPLDHAKPKRYLSVKAAIAGATGWASPPYMGTVEVRVNEKFRLRLFM